MKNKILLSLGVCLIAISFTQAAIRRVGFNATNPVTNVDYTTLQAAHNAANAGDTIQVYPGTSNPTYTCTVNKRLVILGTGSFTDGGFNANTNLQHIGGNAAVTLTLDTGSHHSVFMGLGTENMTGNNGGSSGALTVNCVQFAQVNNITIKRCVISGITLANYAPCNNWLISGCFGNGSVGSIVNSVISPSIPTNGGASILNLVVENCIKINISLGNYILTGTTGTGTLINNTFTTFSDFSNASFLVKDNIFTYGGNDANCNNCVFLNNITPTAIGNSNMNTVGSSGNIFSVAFSVAGGTTSNNTILYAIPNPTDVNGNYPYSIDGAYQVKTGSIAKTASSTGGECGAFGGANPYHIGLLPSTPSIYLLNSSSNTTSGPTYNVTVSVKSNN